MGVLGETVDCSFNETELPSDYALIILGEIEAIVPEKGANTDTFIKRMPNLFDIYTKILGAAESGLYPDDVVQKVSEVKYKLNNAITPDDVNTSLNQIERKIDLETSLGSYKNIPSYINFCKYLKEIINGNDIFNGTKDNLLSLTDVIINRLDKLNKNVQKYV